MSVAGRASQPGPGLTVTDGTSSGSPAATAPHSGGHCGACTVAAPAGGAAAEQTVPMVTATAARPNATPSSIRWRMRAG
jgi:hypothetical protein